MTIAKYPATPQHPSGPSAFAPRVSAILSKETAAFFAQVECLKGSVFDENTIPDILWKFAAQDSPGFQDQESGAPGKMISPASCGRCPSVDADRRVRPIGRDRYMALARGLGFMGPFSHLWTTDRRGGKRAFQYFSEAVSGALQKPPQAVFVIAATLQAKRVASP